MEADIKPIVNNDDEVTKLKARAFDLLMHRENTNKQIAAELSQIEIKLKELNME